MCRYEIPAGNVLDLLEIIVSSSSHADCIECSYSSVGLHCYFNVYTHTLVHFAIESGDSACLITLSIPPFMRQSYGVRYAQKQQLVTRSPAVRTNFHIVSCNDTNGYSRYSPSKLLFGRTQNTVDTKQILAKRGGDLPLANLLTFTCMIDQHSNRNMHL